MTTYNTGNAIGSTDARDLLDNAQALDEAINSTSQTYTDRRGVQRRTLPSLQAEFPNASANAAAAAASATQAANEAQSAATAVDLAFAEATAAQASRVAAEAARDAAMLSAGVYATTAAGLAATVSGRYFSVPSADSAEYLILYLNNAGSAVEQKRYPAAAPVINLVASETIRSVAGSDYAKSASDASLTTRKTVIGQTPASSGSANNLTGTYIFAANPLPACVLESFKIQGAAAKTIKLKRLTRSGQVFTFVEEISLSIVAGLNEFSLKKGNLPTLKFNEGDVFGLITEAGATYFTTVVSNSSTSYYYSGNGVDVTSTYAVAATAKTGDTTLLPIEVSFESSPRSQELLPVLAENLGESFYIGPPTPANGDGYISNGITYFSNHQAPSSSLLKTIRAYAENPVKLVIYVVDYDLSANVFSVSRSFGIQLAAGSNTLAAGVDFPSGVVVKKGGLVGHYYIDNQALGLRANLTNKSVFYWTLNKAPDATFTPAAMTTAAQDREHQISYEFSSVKEEARNPYLFNQKFSANIPYPFISAGWTVSGGVATSSAGFAGSIAYWRFDTKVSGTARYEVTLSAGEVLALFRRRGITFGGGTICTIDFNANTIAFRNDWNGSTTLPAVAMSKTIGFSLVAGRKYRIDLKKDARTITATIYDTVTGQSDAISNYSKSGSQAPGLMIGAPGFANVSGTSTVHSVAFIPAVRLPSVLIFGDSITEGSIATLDSDSWSWKVCANAVGGGLTSAKGSENSSHTISSLAYELRAYRPKYAIVMIGTNDTDMAAWQTNVTNMKSMINSAGAIPIFCTIPPEAADTNPVNVQNPFIRNSGWRYIDMARALTINGDGVTRNEALFADALHPNDAGMLAMYERVRLDVPELFD